MNRNLSGRQRLENCQTAAGNLLPGRNTLVPRLRLSKEKNNRKKLSLCASVVRPVGLVHSTQLHADHNSSQGHLQNHAPLPSFPSHTPPRHATPSSCPSRAKLACRTLWILLPANVLSTVRTSIPCRITEGRTFDSLTNFTLHSNQ